jgi:hypothetical protein
MTVQEIYDMIEKYSKCTPPGTTQQLNKTLFNKLYKHRVGSLPHAGEKLEVYGIILTAL